MVDGTPGGGKRLKREVLTGLAPSRSDGIGIVVTGDAAGARVATTARDGRCRGNRGGVLSHRANGRGAPGPKPNPTACGAVPVTASVCRHVRMEMRPEGEKAVGDTGLPRDEGAAAAKSVLAAESAAYKVVVGEGTSSAPAVAVAGASAKPVPPSGGTAKTETELSAAG